ncbi:MAG: hypothetical protein HYZ71_04505 [Deltaproteobacteria bacterium]|nr:hypothetical protein [Deltaproteobacteria bacterium]
MRPVVFAIGLFAFALVVIRPTADIPINDDWQYSHVTKVLAEKGRFQIDVPIAPALVGQAAVGALWIHAFGFSHVKLRILTAIISVALILLFNQILGTLNVDPWTRGVALATLVLNPFFLHFATSFMTENYGYTVMLLGILLWLRDSRSLEHLTALRLSSALILGASFWIRQFCVLALPALLLAALWPERRRLGPFLKSATTYLVVFALPIVAHALWSRHSGNVTQAASEPLRSLVRINTMPFFYQGAILLIYSTGFLLPLVLGRFQLTGHPRRRLGLVTLWIGGGVLYCYTQGHPAIGISQHLHQFFPFSTNIINPHGLGPLTLTDAYYQEVGPPTSVWPWALMGYALAVLTILALSSPRLTRSSSPFFSRFVFLFSLLTGYVVIMAFRKMIFDRYYFGIMLVFIPFLSTVARIGQRRALSLLALGLLGLYSLLGTHDYFRWQETRWALVEEALARGVHTTDLDGGYEVNGWFSVERQAGPDDNVTDPYFRPIRPFAVVITVGPGDEILSELTPPRLLFRLPHFKLVRRKLL